MPNKFESRIHQTRSRLLEGLTSHFCLNQLDKKDTTILKAIAILAIVFHNFFHVVTKVHENEFDFDPSRFHVFLQAVAHPSLAIQSFFSFYGHFGVQVFIFLSAYGLAKSHWDDKGSWPSFMWSRIKKLYPMFGLVVLFWAILVAMHVSPIYVIRDDSFGILLMLAGVSNIIPGLGLPPVGPWWFIPFIMQFYAIWPFLRRLTQRFGWPALVVLSILCFVLTYAANPILEQHWSMNLNLTPIARMRVLCLGIIAARYPIRLRYYIAVPAFALMILGSEYHGLAYLISLASVVMSLWLYTKTRAILRNSRALEKVGEYSLAIFLVNGIVRVPFVYFAHTPIMQLSLGAASAAVTFAIAAFFHYLLAPAPETTPQPVPSAHWIPAKPVEVGSD